MGHSVITNPTDIEIDRLRLTLTRIASLYKPGDSAVMSARMAQQMAAMAKRALEY